jgi:hypothetical protein
LIAGTLPGGSCCDNKAVFDKYGNLFVSYIGANDELALSTNGGASFVDLITTGIGSDYPGVAVGPDGTGASSVWAFGSSSGATMSARGAKVTGLGSIGAFTAAQTTTVGQFGGISIGSTGAVSITGTHCTGSANGPCPIKVATDANGLTAGGFSAPVTVVTSNVGTFTPIPAEDNRTIHAHPNLSYNQTSNRLFLTYTDRPAVGSADTDIYMQFSDNGGASWSPRIKMNDDGATGKSQFYSDICVDQTTGRISTTWYDARNSPTNVAAQIYAAGSMRGRDWTPNVQVATGLSNANLASSFEFGDYDDMDCHGGFFYRTWADNASPSTLTPSNTDAPSDQDIATARVDLIFTPSPDDWFKDEGLDGTDFARVIGAVKPDVDSFQFQTPIVTPTTRNPELLNGGALARPRANETGHQPRLAASRLAGATSDPVETVLAHGLTIEL